MADNTDNKHGLTNRLLGCLKRGKRCSRKIMPLAERLRDGKVKICKVTGDRKACARMASMGVYPGVEADIICENGHNCMLKVHGGVISLDSETSANILVERV